jgi:hypothetical protein
MLLCGVQPLPRLPSFVFGSLGVYALASSAGRIRSGCCWQQILLLHSAPVLAEWQQGAAVGTQLVVLQGRLTVTHVNTPEVKEREVSGRGCRR